jgi:cell wall-associated NlpC family hydrolase
MPARPSRGPWRHAAAVLPASALVIGLAMFSLPASAATSRGTVQASGAWSAPASPSLWAPASSAPRWSARQQTARRVGPLAPAVHRPAVVVSRAALVLARAASLRGRPYQYGAAGPGAFDCSGFTRYVFRTAVGRSLPHSAQAQYMMSHKIAKSAIRPGDLVFFISSGYVYHVGIYAGHGLIWHAPHTGDHVRLARIFSSSWVAGRVL